MNLDFKSQSELYEMRYPVAFGYELELDPNCRFHPEIFEKYIKSLKNGDNFEGTIAIGVKMINQDSVVSINTKDKSTVIPLNDAITIITILKMLASQNYDIVNDREDQINDKDLVKKWLENTKEFVIIDNTLTGVRAGRKDDNKKVKHTESSFVTIRENTNGVRHFDYEEIEITDDNYEAASKFFRHEFEEYTYVNKFYMGNKVRVLKWNGDNVYLHHMEKIELLYNTSECERIADFIEDMSKKYPVEVRITPGPVGRAKTKAIVD